MVCGTFRETKLYAAININVCVYIEKEKYIQNLLELHRKVFNKDTTIVGLEFMEQTYKGNVCFCWLLLLPGFLHPALLVTPLCCVVCCMMQRYCETVFFFLVSFFPCFHTKCVIWWNNTATGYIDPAGAQCEHRQAAPEPSMSPARFDEF